MVKMGICGLVSLGMVSCAMNELDTLQDLSLAAGGVVAADALGADPAVSAAAGLGMFSIGNVAQKRRDKLQLQAVANANATGKQTVMLETYKAMQDRQRSREAGLIDMHEVVVPMDGYTTIDGVVLDEHDKVILTR